MSSFFRKFRPLFLLVFTTLCMFTFGSIITALIGSFTNTSNGSFSLYDHLRSKRDNVAAYSETITEQIAKEALPQSIKNSLEDPRFNGYGAYIVANNTTDLDVSFNATPYVENSLDSKRRPSVANAVVNQAIREYNPRNDYKDNKVTLMPLGYHQRTSLKGKYTLAYNRGHLIGYAIAGKLSNFDASENNKQNIITQTSWANQASESSNTGQNYYEGLIRQAQDQGRTIRYRATPMYVDNELVPRGVHLEAKSSDGALQFNVYVPNVQGNIIINYKTGYTVIRK